MGLHGRRSDQTPAESSTSLMALPIRELRPRNVSFPASRRETQGNAVRDLRKGCPDPDRVLIRYLPPSVLSKDGLGEALIYQPFARTTPRMALDAPQSTSTSGSDGHSKAKDPGSMHPILDSRRRWERNCAQSSASGECTPLLSRL